MRTVADGNITAALITTLSDPGKIPYISVNIDSTEYWSRLLYLEHHEEPYRERATIGLSNRDGALDDLDIVGEEFEIGYGYDSSGNGGSSTDKCDTATLWVKSVSKISQGGERILQIYAEGMWSRLRNEKLLPGVVTWKASTAYVVDQYVNPATPNGKYYKCTTAGTTAASEPTWAATVTDGSVVWEEVGPALPYNNVFNATHTIEEIMELIVSNAMGWTWVDCDDDDGYLTNTDHNPIMEIGASGFEPGAAVLYRLVWMTKIWLRCRPSTTMQPIYRTDAEAADIVYYSDQAPYFDEYDEQEQLLEPNSIVIVCNADPSTGEFGTEDYPVILGTASDIPGNYYEVVEMLIDANIRDQDVADERAAAVLWRIASESSGGRILLPFHDPRVEIGDKVACADSRV